MGIPEQDLTFKLKSIGVRIDDDEARIDSEIIQAILEGKRLPQPREVILRDAEAKASAPSPLRRRPPARRLPSNMVKPGRRRSLIQKVEPRIKTLPPSEKPAPAPPVATAPVGAGETTSSVPRDTPPPVVETTEKKAYPAKETKTKRPKKVQPEIDAEDLRAYRGSVRDLEKEDTEAEAMEPGLSTRSRRRAQRREEKKQSDQSENILSFKQAAPEEAITLSEGMTVRDFADKLGVKSKDLIKMLFQQGNLVTINHVLEPDTALAIAEQLGVEARLVSFEEEVQLQQEATLGASASQGSEVRGPVVTIMGHVDHGKTTLLDTIRASKVADGESGGITQHIGAYQVTAKGQSIAFLDTPGHEAFTLMRARGARVTDLVVLVVAADDGVMPQTVEAIDHAKAAGVPIVVAINKIDKADANPDRVKKELSEHGLTVEAWGGDTVSIEISAKNNEGVSELLEMILLTADLLELKATPELPAIGVVLEARKEVGRGIMATVLVQDGTIHAGDLFVSGATWGRVRSMNDDLGQKIGDAGPSTPVEISGLNGLPEAGDLFQIVSSESQARSIAEFRQQEHRKKELAPVQGKISLEQLFDQIQEGAVKELPVVLKADVQGSVEVLIDTLTKLSTDQVKIQVILSGVGAITTNDILLASASSAIVVGFNVRPEKNATDLAEKEQVDVRLHTVIYEISDEIKKSMTGLLEPTFKDVDKGRAEVRELFKVPKFGSVAGSHVVEGVIPRNASVRLLRDNVVVYQGKISSLRRFKEDVSEVRSGFDCGIRLDKYQDVKPGDIIEAYVQETVAPTL
jgi:translation initiation factor IF-2